MLYLFFFIDFCLIGTAVYCLYKLFQIFLICYVDKRLENKSISDIKNPIIAILVFISIVVYSIIGGFFLENCKSKEDRKNLEQRLQKLNYHILFLIFCLAILLFFADNLLKKYLF